MNKNKKQKIIILVIIVTIVVGLVIILLNGKGRKNKENLTIEKIETLDISQVLETENIEKSKYEKIKNKNREIASKYIVNQEIYELKANVEFTNTLGNMIYVREDYEKLNIYQTEYKLDKYENINSQVEQIIEEFKQMCKNYLNIENDEKAKNEKLYGEASQKEEIPLGESIYYDNRLYSITYEKEGKVYDINIYRNDEKIICELVYNIKEE